MLTKFESFHKSLESLSEEEISSKLSSSTWSVEQRKWAFELLERRSSFKRDAREEETLSIAKDANRIALEALTIARDEAAAAASSARWAKIAAIIAAIVAIISMATTIIMALFTQK